MNTVTPKKKNIVIVLDESGTMSIPDDWRNPSITRIERAKEAAHAVLDTLSARDWVSVRLSPPLQIFIMMKCLRDKI